MTEPPRPPGDGSYGMPPNPSSPPPPPASYSMPGEAPAPGYAPPPTSGGPQYAAPPPGGAYPPPGAYPPVGGTGPGVPPPGYATADEKNWALIAHFGGAAGVLIGGGILGWVAPLIA